MTDAEKLEKIRRVAEHYNSEFARQMDMASSPQKSFQYALGIIDAYRNVLEIIGRSSHD